MSGFSGQMSGFSGQLSGFSGHFPYSMEIFKTSYHGVTLFKTCCAGIITRLQTCPERFGLARCAVFSFFRRGGGSKLPNRDYPYFPDNCPDFPDIFHYFQYFDNFQHFVRKIWSISGPPFDRKNLKLCIAPPQTFQDTCWYVCGRVPGPAQRVV